MDIFGKFLAGLSFIAVAVLVPPFIWHIKNVNIPAICLIFWFIITNLLGFIDAIIWSDSDFYQAYDGKGYCDIAIKLKLGSITGKLCAVSALAFQLLMILKANNVRFMNNKSKFKIVFDSICCLLTPIIIMPLSYIVQGSRIGIAKYGGCTGIYFSWVYLVIQAVPALILAVIAICFAILTVYTFYTIKRDVKDILKCTNSGLTLKRFSRLLIFSGIIIFVLTPLEIYTFTYDLTLQDFKIPFDWHFIHDDQIWNHTDYAAPKFSTFYYKWIDIGLSFITFLIFGIGSDAVQLYKTILIKVGLGKIFNIKDSNNDIDDEFKNYGTQNIEITTKTGTNQSKKSQFSAGTESTIHDDLDLEFTKIINDEEFEGNTANLSPFKYHSNKALNNIYTIDLEKGQDQISEINDDDDSHDIEYIIKAEADTNDISYHYHITKK